eukprot:6160305-Ditylum_brightwellii.AAC.1
MATSPSGQHLGLYKVWLQKVNEDVKLHLICQEYISRGMMHNTELHMHLSPNQYGGRKGRSAIDISVITVFNLDTLYLMQANMAFTYCDARAYYNRVVVIMAALLEQAAGLSLEQSIFFTKMLKNLEYQLIIAYRPSKKKNYHSAQHPVHGVGQGPTYGPPKWTCTVNT